MGHKKWTDSKIVGGKVQPKGLKTRFSDHGSHLKASRSVGDTPGLEQEDWIENVDKGVQIMPRGNRSRFSMAGTYLQAAPKNRTPGPKVKTVIAQMQDFCPALFCKPFVHSLDGTQEMDR